MSEVFIKCTCSFYLFTELVGGEVRYRLRMRLDGLPDGIRQLVGETFGGQENGMEAWGSATGPEPIHNYITFLPNKKLSVGLTQKHEEEKS